MCGHVIITANENNVTRSDERLQCSRLGFSRFRIQNSHQTEWRSEWYYSSIALTVQASACCISLRSVENFKWKRDDAWQLNVHGGYLWVFHRRGGLVSVYHEVLFGNVSLWTATRYCCWCYWKWCWFSSTSNQRVLMIIDKTELSMGREHRPMGRVHRPIGRVHRPIGRDRSGWTVTFRKRLCKPIYLYSSTFSLDWYFRHWPSVVISSQSHSLFYHLSLLYNCCPNLYFISTASIKERSLLIHILTAYINLFYLLEYTLICSTFKGAIK